MTHDANPAKLNCEHAQKVMEFLNGIGLRVDVVPGAKGFIEGILLVDGTVHADPDCEVSGLLHEAGHLAIIPNDLRHHMSGHLYGSLRTILDESKFLTLDPDSQRFRALVQTSDPEVTAWAWAVGKHLDIPEELIVMDHEYEGDGEGVRLGLSLNCYSGINGLMHAGFCQVRKNPYRNLPVYPELAFWLQR